MLDFQKLLSGLFQNGGEAGGVAPPIADPTGAKPLGFPAPTAPVEMPGMKPGGGSIETPGINPNAPMQTGQRPELPLAGVGGMDWKERMLGGLQGIQQAAPQQQGPPPMQPMDMEAIKRLQFAHQQQQGGIVPRPGRY